MDKFLNVMYDFFAFAFPGTCAIGSVMLLKQGDKFLYDQVRGLISEDFGYLLLVLVFAGYLVGYIVRPFARSFLLINITIPLFGKFLRKDEMENYDDLLKDLKGKEKSYDYLKIRELLPKAAQYIEFWDMHITMSHNLAFASAVFVFVQGINMINGSSPLVSLILVAIGLIAFFALLRISFNYSKWWSDDLESAKTFIKENKKELMSRVQL